MEAITGEDVNIKCLVTKTIDSIIAIKWRHSNGSILFNCDEEKNPCEKNTTRHSLGENDIFISSTVTIRNVSLMYEDEYDIIIVYPSYRQTCKFNLTVDGIYL